VIELRFHHDLYDGFAIDEASKVYGPYGAMELVREPNAYLVRITATADAAAQGIDEKILAAELGNYALGMTIEKRLSHPPAPAPADAVAAETSGGAA
jgi:hypothetical protein